MTKAEAFTLAKAGRASKILDKKFRCSDGAVRTRRQMVEWYIERGAVIKDVAGYGSALQLPDGSFSSSIGQTGVDYAARLLTEVKP